MYSFLNGNDLSCFNRHLVAFDSISGRKVLSWLGPSVRPFIRLSDITTTLLSWNFSNLASFASLSHISIAWWRHQMETFSALLAICAGNSPVPVNSSHKGQWRGALMFPLICVGINGWVNNREAGDLRRYRAHYDVIAMVFEVRVK